jgi:hypothetical protein
LLALWIVALKDQLAEFIRGAMGLLHVLVNINSAGQSLLGWTVMTDRGYGFTTMLGINDRGIEYTLARSAGH